MIPNHFTLPLPILPTTMASLITAAMAALILMAGAQETGDRLFISEIVAVGNDSFQDEDGESLDWLEIYNPTGEAIDLAGYHLTDDVAIPTKWTFPAYRLQPRNYLVVFASDKDRAILGSELHTNFKLTAGGEYLALIRPDGITIASEFVPTFPVQAAGFSYGIEGLSPDGARGYFDPPTSGTENGTLFSAPLVAPVITPPCASFTSEIAVTIAPAFVGGEIRYTTDGSDPTATSTLYNTPLDLSATTQLRARVFDPAAGGGGGATAAGTFQKLAASSNLTGIDSPETFTSDLPIMIVEGFNTGGIPGPGAILKTARVLVFDIDPDTGRSSLASGPDACFRIGIRRRGQSSAGFAKPQYRVELRDENDEDFDFSLLGLPAESDWIFNGPWTDKSLVRNSFSFELGRTIGNEAPGTKHFEMFLSTNGGDLVASEYAGVYVLLEEIKLSKNRTDLVELGPSDNAEPEITGGYMMRFEPPGIANDGPRANGWNSVEIIEPGAPTLEQRSYLGTYLDDFAATLGWAHGSGANNSGTVDPDPLTGYPAFIDVDSFVNHFVISELGRDQDAYVRSEYMFKDRGGKLHKGPLWDHNLIMGTGCCFDNRNPRGWQYRDNSNRGGRDHGYEPDWFVPLMRDPDFRQRVIDRWAKLRRGGPFESGNLFARLDAQADPLVESAGRNFTKWNTLFQNGPGFPSPSTATWEQQIDFMKQWLTERTEWIDGQFPSIPELIPGGGAAFAGAGEVAVQGAIIYLNGHEAGRSNIAEGLVMHFDDLTGGEASVGEEEEEYFGVPLDPAFLIDGANVIAVELHQQSSGSSDLGFDLELGGTVPPGDAPTISVSESTQIRARSRSASDEWSGPSEGVFVVGIPASPTNLVISEMNYHPLPPTAAEIAADPTLNDDDFEWIEVRNVGTNPIDLSGGAFVAGIGFEIPVGTLVEPGGYAVFVENQTAFELRYGTGLPVAGTYAKKLNNDGESVRLNDLTGALVAGFIFNDTWYRETDGIGSTLVLRNDSFPPSDYGSPSNWRASSQNGGTPGTREMIAGENFESWQAANFTAAGLADPLVSGPLADPDGDSLDNLLEYAMGLDPRSSSFESLPEPIFVSIDGLTYPALIFRRKKDLPDVALSMELSPDLVTWSQSGTFFGEPFDNPDGTETLILRHNLPISPDNRRWMARLKVRLP